MSVATARAKILDLLQRQIFVTSTELNAIAYRYSARIYELRQDGHQIQTMRDHPVPGVTTYAYLAKPANNQE